ncbi:MAG: uroporphyrinogen-III C-methyltransferase [Candidatus Rokubacteria bacterium]|nr:uroporphyrinogen-III C-methyltransferase [Candidatus Rokubacteria bacterium]
MRRGSVALVGAGPGDPSLLTLRGRRLLRRADVVVYDRLVSPAVLAHAPATARRIFAGKACGDHALPQGEINAVLVEQARRGARVVRLKGGDPFVFGRGGEEAEALAAAGVPFEIVPGVSAAVAAPASAGIPLTHRGLASSFAVVTGHEDSRKAGARVDWRALAAGVDTLVVLMGLQALPRIASELVAGGRAGSTPVALVAAGTTAREQVVVTTLAGAAAAAARARLEAPVTIVIGDVVRVRARLATLGAAPVRRRRQRRRRAPASVVSPTA